MKKLISAVLAVVLTLSLGVTAFADTDPPQTKFNYQYYDSEGTLQTDTIDTTVYAPIPLGATASNPSGVTQYNSVVVDPDALDPEDENAPKGNYGMRFVITEPCVVYAWLSCRNRDQVAGPVMAIDKMAISYEMKLGASGDAFIDKSYPPYGEEYGEYEYAKYTITKDMIEAAEAEEGGQFILYWTARAVKYPGLTFEQLGQIITTGIAAYSTEIKSVEITSLDVPVGKEVNAKYFTGDRDPVYSVDITWGGLEFDYNANEVWDAVNHAWVPGETTSWALKEGSSNEISVASNSSVPIKASFSFAKGTDYEDVSGTFSSDALLLDIPAGDTAAVAQTVEFSLSGTVPNTIQDQYTPIGTITVTLENAMN